MTPEQIETISSKIVSNLFTTSDGAHGDWLCLYAKGDRGPDIEYDWIKSMVKRVLEKHA